MLTGPETLKQGRILADYEEVHRVYAELHEAAHEDFETVKMLRRAGKEIYFSLPGIFREGPGAFTGVSDCRRSFCRGLACTSDGDFLFGPIDISRVKNHI